MRKTVAGFYPNSDGKSAVVRWFGTSADQERSSPLLIYPCFPIGQGAGALFCRKKMSERSELLFPEEKSTRLLASLKSQPS